MQLKGLEPARFARLSLLLDEALAVPGERRAEWLAELALGEPETAAQVSELLASMAAAQADGLLETRDVLRRRLAAAIADENSARTQVGPYRIIRALGQGGMAPSGSRSVTTACRGARAEAGESGTAQCGGRRAVCARAHDVVSLTIPASRGCSSGL